MLYQRHQPRGRHDPTGTIADCGTTHVAPGERASTAAVSTLIQAGTCIPSSRLLAPLGCADGLVSCVRCAINVERLSSCSEQRSLWHPHSRMLLVVRPRGPEQISQPVKIAAADYWEFFLIRDRDLSTVAALDSSRWARRRTLIVDNHRWTNPKRALHRPQRYRMTDPKSCGEQLRKNSNP